MNVLVIGGTRFIGPPTVRELLNHGHQVTVFHRGQTQTELPEGVGEVLGDRTDPTALTNAFDGVQPDGLIDLCAYFERHWTVLQDALGDRRPRHLLVSSCDVYRNFGGLLGREEDPPDPTPLTEQSPLRTFRYPYREGENARAGLEDYDKIPLEQMVTVRGGMVARLPMVYGPGDGQHRVRQYLRKLDGGAVQILLGEKEAQWKTCRAHVWQVARAMVRILESGAPGETYNVAEQPALTEREWVDAIAEAAQRPCSVHLVPDEAVKDVEGHIDHPQWHIHADSSKLRSTLGFSEDTSLEEGLKETVNWERSDPGEPWRPEEEEPIHNALRRLSSDR